MICCLIMNPQNVNTALIFIIVNVMIIVNDSAFVNTIIINFLHLSVS